MVKARIPETDHGIQGEFTVAAYDEMQRHLRDRGWIETQALIQSGIAHACALEIGPGPGYLGLEWLKRTQGTTLVGLDISPDMRALAEKNARAYGLQGRAAYHLGNGSRLPFDDQSFDAVFTNGSLHEWADPGATFDEIARVLRPGGRYWISDLRRDMPALLHWFLRASTRPRSIRPGLDTSIQAAYIPAELGEMMAGSGLAAGRVGSTPLGISLSGARAA